MAVGRTSTSQVGVGFGSGALASRRVAGVAAAARAVHDLAGRGVADVCLVIEDGSPLTQSAWQDIHRICGETRVAICGPGDAGVPVLADTVPSTWQVLRATGKASDGLIARLFNRPISRCCSALLLTWPGMRPAHATFGTAAIAAVMFVAFLVGGSWGLIAGGLLFHAASVFDGVDGEIARATFRTSPAGASLDSAVDILTNLLFVLGLTINLSVREGALAAGLGVWSLGMLAIGFWLIGRRNRRHRGPLRFEWLKQQVQPQSGGRALSWLAGLGTFLTTRDSIAFFFMVMILAGLAMPALGVLALAATIWFCVLIVALVSAGRTTSMIQALSEGSE